MKINVVFCDGKDILTMMGIRHRLYPYLASAMTTQSSQANNKTTNIIHKPTYKLLTYYSFVDVADPVFEVERHLGFCKDLGMRGRVYIGTEGISATVSCNQGQYRAYKHFLMAHPLFVELIPQIEQKWTDVDGHQFEKMTVKYRDEIVSLGEKVTAQDVKDSHKHVSPDQLKDIIDNKKEGYEILDMRNTYEYKLGHFKEAIPAGTINFREMQDIMEKYKERFEGKKVIMYCTGGIRCEKLSVLLGKHGFDNFYALDGGVVNYVNTHNDGNWLGNLYTFDGLISTSVGDEHTHTTIGECIYTGHKTNQAYNCRYSPCNARILARTRDYKAHAGFCSKECFDNAKQDILIKNEDRDKIDYKNIRGDIKSEKKLFSDARERIASHLDKMLGDTVFNHISNQKEDIVDEKLIQEYWK